jgi:sec-independent protein translocase protein TatA
MLGIGPTEMVIVGIVAVILFGSRLPSVARSLGKSLTEFKKGMRDFENEMHSSIYSEPAERITHKDDSKSTSPPAEAGAETADEPVAETHA